MAALVATETALCAFTAPFSKRWDKQVTRKHATDHRPDKTS
jgi:hypothetical protein